jgi:hypothetical protein
MPVRAHSEGDVADGTLEIDADNVSVSTGQHELLACMSLAFKYGEILCLSISETTTCFRTDIRI